MTSLSVSFIRIIESISSYNIIGIHEMFDLKGSSVSRTANCHEKVKKDNGKMRLMD